MKNGPELATRFYKELTDIQVGHHTLLLLIQGSAVLYGLLNFCLALGFVCLFFFLSLLAVWTHEEGLGTGHRRLIGRLSSSHLPEPWILHTVRFSRFLLYLLLCLIILRD